MPRASGAILVFLVTILLNGVSARKHHLDLKDEVRTTIPISNFGFLKGGVLDVKVSEFKVLDGADLEKSGSTFGFILYRTLSDAANPYSNSLAIDGKCLLRSQDGREDFIADEDTAVARLIFDFQAKTLNGTCTDKWKSSPNTDRTKRNSFDKVSDSHLFSQRLTRSEAGSQDVHLTPMKEIGSCDKIESVPLSPASQPYGVKFLWAVTGEADEGMYNLYFHQCPSSGHWTSAVDIIFDVTETNGDNYLSAGEMPLPMLYFIMSTVFLASGCFWVGVLCKSKRDDVYKIHYLMALLVFLKSLSLAFHGINYHFIQTEGFHMEAWAVLYYITHLLKGAVLFITIVLIGTGWAFVKHILSGKDKKIFMIVVPLQVLANVAYIITEESEAGQVEHMTWGEVFIFVDLICCGAILFPVVWSIKHLQEASQTDGKAAANLRKLRLFRHFYILVVCYIYFTRIIVYLLKITVPFRYEWLDEFFFELATYVFFVMTASKFRPAGNNPYLQLARQDDEDDLELDQVLTQNGATEAVVNVGRHKKPRQHSVATADEKESLVSAEDSHELD